MNWLIVLALIALVVGSDALVAVILDRKEPAQERAERLAEQAARDDRFGQILGETRLDEALDSIASIDPEVLAYISSEARS